MDRLEKAMEKVREQRREALMARNEPQLKATQNEAVQEVPQYTIKQPEAETEAIPIAAQSIADGRAAPAAAVISQPVVELPPKAIEAIVTASPPVSFVSKVARSFALSRGVYRWVLGIGLGVVASGAMPPFNLVLLLLIAFPGLIWLLDGARSARQAAADGWRFGFGFFTPGLYWTALSMFVDIKQFWFMVPFALFGLPAMLACWVGLATAVARFRFAGRDFPVASLRGILLLAACWTGGEWLRGHALTGFPWALIGYTWSSDNKATVALLQLSSITGIYGVSLVTFIMMAGPAALALPTTNVWIRHRPVVFGVILFFALGAWGTLRMKREDPVWPNTVIRIVQPNIAQTMEYSADTTLRDFRHVLLLAKEPSQEPLTAEVWPEAAVDYYTNRDVNARRSIATAVPDGGMVITGTLRANPTGPVQQVWNSVAAIDHAGNLVASYDKNHLVPFGEYVPFRSILPIKKIVADRSDFSTGPGPTTLPLRSPPPVSPIICYEAIFPHAVVDETSRPAWLLNVTNDAWFGMSIGPPQHFMISRVRAIEEGLPLLRVANTGISGAIDPHGRILAKLGLGVSGVLDVALPKPLPFVTFYARYGDMILLGLILITAGLALLPKRPTPPC